MQETVATDNPKLSKQILLDCTPQQAQAIVQPLVAMSLLVMGLGSSTKPKEVEVHAEQLAAGKKMLCLLLEAKLSRPVRPERLADFHLASGAYMGGSFDLSFTETTPSSEGNLRTAIKVRLMASRNTVQERFAHFVQTNNPLGRGQLYDMARQVMYATGM